VAFAPTKNDAPAAAVPTIHGCCTVKRPGVWLQVWVSFHSPRACLAVFGSHTLATPLPQPKRKTQKPAVKAAASGDTAPHGRAASDARLRSRLSPCGTGCMLPSREPLLCTRGLGKRKGCKKRYCVVGGRACRFRVSPSFHPEVSLSCM
jgi:hypothetical protein